MKPEPIRTGGVICPECNGPVATFEKMTPLVIWFRCPVCAHRWVAEAPGASQAIH